MTVRVAVSRYQLVLVTRAAAVEELASGGSPNRAARFRQLADVFDGAAASPVDASYLLEFESVAQAAADSYLERHGGELPTEFADLLDVVPSVREMRNRLMMSSRSAYVAGVAAR